MRIPSSWARAPEGGFSGCGWSDASPEEAVGAAQDAVARIAAALARGGLAKARYLYGERPLPEPVLESLPGAVVTRNACGERVLNTERLLFADIDLPEAHGRRGRRGAGGGLTPCARIPPGRTPSFSCRGSYG